MGMQIGIAQALQIEMSGATITEFCSPSQLFFEWRGLDMMERRLML